MSNCCGIAPGWNVESEVFAGGLGLIPKIVMYTPLLDPVENGVGIVLKEWFLENILVHQMFNPKLSEPSSRK